MSRGLGRAVVAGLLAGLALLLGPEAAAACPVCFSATDENRLAFIGTTVFLTVLPLGMLAVAGVWLHRRSREIETGEGWPGSGDAAGVARDPDDRARGAHRRSGGRTT